MLFGVITSNVALPIDGCICAIDGGKGDLALLLPPVADVVAEVFFKLRNASQGGAQTVAPQGEDTLNGDTAPVIVTRRPLTITVQSGSWIAT